MTMMTAYSAALVISCFFMAWGAVLLTRPLLGMLRTSSDEKYSNAVIVAWIALGFLQVVGMPFAWWCLCVVVSIVSVLGNKPAFSAFGWVMLIAAGLGSAGLVLALGAPDYLVTEACIVVAASLAGFVVSKGRRGLLCERAAAIPLAMCLGYVAYSAALTTIMASVGNI